MQPNFHKTYTERNVPMSVAENERKTQLVSPWHPRKPGPKRFPMVVADLNGDVGILGLLTSRNHVSCMFRHHHHHHHHHHHCHCLSSSSPSFKALQACAHVSCIFCSGPVFSGLNWAMDPSKTSLDIH